MRGELIWQLAGISRPKPLVTAFSLVVDVPAAMAAKALEYADARILKIQLDGAAEDADRVRVIRRLGFGAMLGTMDGTSLSIGTHFLLAQGCDLADLDGAYYLRRDREPPMLYDGGLVQPSDPVWAA